MALNTIEEIIQDIRLGKMVILMDDEDRENEGDIVMAAECVTAEHIAFMDLDRLYFELERYKAEQGLHTLIITREGIRELLHDHNWYRLLNGIGDLDALTKQYDILWGTSWSATDYLLLKTILSKTTGEVFVLPSHASEAEKLQAFHRRILCPPVLSASDWVTTPSIRLWQILTSRATSPSPTYVTDLPMCASSGANRW